MTVRPAASIVRVLGPARLETSAVPPTAIMYSPLEATASAIRLDGLIVTTFALVTIRSGKKSAIFYSVSSLGKLLKYGVRITNEHCLKQT